MRRVVEKVKDIVEICPFTHLHDFSADPGLTLAGYHFTDITADLMSKWINTAAAVRRGNGAALALAGFRGVGKSHFLSVLGAIAGRPELRGRISDPHVASSAERLPRRHGSVGYVRRGTGTTLLDELKRAVSPILDVNPGTLGDSIYDLMLRAAEAAGDAPLLILIDTALGRESRVSRDDGVFLSEIGEAAKAIGVFVGVALDDDISGADGPNASISATFNIDYLDQEHLYRIVDSAIFSKHNQMRPLLHEIYEDYRADLPGFRWSEQRFSSLYPLHPATVEIAPLVRLYIQDFALLGFAADAGVKILGRPAHSLIGLEEVFDSTETRLRNAPDLSGVFEAFDALEREVIAKVPVLSRHPAKLVLKGLLLLSLGGDAATAEEIGAALMISAAHNLDIAGLLDTLTEASAGALVRRAKPNGQFCYAFRLASKADVDELIAKASQAVPEAAIADILRGQFGERFSDYNPLEAVTYSAIAWRGSVRRGMLVWPPAESDGENDDRRLDDQADWVVRVDGNGNEAEDGGVPTAAIWVPAALTLEESSTLRRHYVLCRDVDVREQIGEGLATAVRLSSIAVEKIWTRVMFTDARLRHAGREFEVGTSALGCHSLAQLLSNLLAPLLEVQFPDHPAFLEQLEAKQVAFLISEFMCGSRSGGADAQRAAESFALPLGLATGPRGALQPASADILAENPIVRAAIGSDASPSEFSLTEVSTRLRAVPFGLSREAQRLVMASMVAQRLVDFVTSKGDRINYRSLDLQIIWDDIVGIAKPLTESYSPERLLSWARIVTGNTALKSVERAEDRLLIIDSLAGWLAGWTESRVLSEFDALPDELLSAGIWRSASNLRKSFGAMADLINALLNNDLSLDSCLQSIADLYCDSEAEYENKKLDLRILREFITGIRKRSEIVSYLSLCERTADENIESLKLKLVADLEVAGREAPTGANGDAAELWRAFRQSYIDYYAERHDSVMGSAGLGESLKEILRSNEWATFESLAGVAADNRECFSAATSMVRELRQLNCSTDVRKVLPMQPFCGCSFSLNEAERLANLARDLKRLVDAGLAEMVAVMLASRESLEEATDSGAMRSSIRSILERLAAGASVSDLSSQEVRLLRLTMQAAHLPTTKQTIEIAASAADEQADVWAEDVLRVEDFVNSELKM